MSAMTAGLHDIYRGSLNPSTEFGPVPFWFWNDDLQPDELLRQLRAFHEAGCGGVIPHARIGLSRRIGYLTEPFLAMIRTVVEEADRLQMKVILYDEGSYPSGSACGAVVAQNPDFASRAIGLWQLDLEGPVAGYWRPNTGRALRDRHEVTVAARCGTDERIDASELRILDPAPHDVIPYDLPAGRWKLLSVWSTDSGGHIRGAHAEQDSGTATAPAAGDILNPDAVDCFVRLTHERYRHVVGDHFGRTVIAMFTDEPSVFGKSPKRPADPRAWTPGFGDWLQTLWGQDRRDWLPSLWLDYGTGTEAFRARYREAVERRLHEVFYGAQNRWCRSNGLALTGHPGASNDMASLEAFHLPGQDMVWRYVTPGSPTALEGAHSVAPKAASSGARRSGARRSLTELGGAYGWQLTLDEVKWLFDWHLVRGNNLLNPHAFFYSIRQRRAWESEPDLGLHNVWWPWMPRLLRYAGRTSALLADAETVCPIAIAADASQLPWRAAATLLQAQRDFNYVDGADLVAGSVRHGRLHVRGGAYRAVVIDAEPQSIGVSAGLIDALRAAGIIVVDAWQSGAELLQQLAPIAPTVSIYPAHADLRVQHLRRAGVDLFHVVNEGEGPIEGRLRLPASGTVEVWDLLRGTRTACAAPDADTEDQNTMDQSTVQLQLARRESRMLVVDSAGPVTAVPVAGPAALLDGLPNGVTVDIAPHTWSVHTNSGEPCGFCLGDWSRQPGWELFSGTLVYRTTLRLPRTPSVLDAGQVGDIAECRVDGDIVDTALWAPHRLQLPPGTGAEQQIELHVTNSMANEYEGAQLPSGLLGPVRLHIPHHQEKETDQ